MQFKVENLKLNLLNRASRRCHNSRNSTYNREIGDNKIGQQLGTLIQLTSNNCILQKFVVDFCRLKIFVVAVVVKAEKNKKFIVAFVVVIIFTIACCFVVV